VSKFCLSISVKPNDVVVIAPKVEYAYEGRMKLFEANYPATDDDDEAEIK